MKLLQNVWHHIFLWDSVVNDYRWFEISDTRILIQVCSTNCGSTGGQVKPHFFQAGSKNTVWHILNLWPKVWVKIALCLESKQSAIVPQNAAFCTYNFQNFPMVIAPRISVEVQAPPFVITPIWPPRPHFQIPSAVYGLSYNSCSIRQMLKNPNQPKSQVTKFTCNGSMIHIEIGIFLFSHKFSSIWAQTQN